MKGAIVEQQMEAGRISGRKVVIAPPYLAVQDEVTEEPVEFIITEPLEVDGLLLIHLQGRPRMGHRLSQHVRGRPVRPVVGDKQKRHLLPSFIALDHFSQMRQAKERLRAGAQSFSEPQLLLPFLLTSLCQLTVKPYLLCRIPSGGTLAPAVLRDC
jgi:hypothetical protein